VTAHLLAGGINDDSEKSLAQVCATALAAKIYKECIRYYPFVLGAQPVRMIDLAAFYAAVANEGALPKAHAIDSIEVDGKMVFQYPNAPLPFVGAADRTSFYQLKTMLQGVVARGTARAIGDLSPFVAGKTGTTEMLSTAGSSASPMTSLSRCGSATITATANAARSARGQAAPV
jgi:penicillin-binding protein 1A